MPTPTTVASAFTTVTTATSGSFSLNCGSGSSRAVFVTFAGYGTSNIVSSVTVGGVAATLVQFTTVSDWFLATYVAISPPTGSQTVAFTFSAASFYGTIGADSWSEVNQSTPNGTVVVTSSSTNASPSATVTGTTAGNVVRADAWLYVSAWSYAAGQTELWKNIASGVRSGGAEYTAAGGDKTMTWVNESTPYAMHAFEALASVDPPVNTVAPAITGTAQVGQTLTTTTGTWTGSPSSYAYQWKRADDSGFTTNVTNIGTDQNTFVLTASESGKYVRCVVTATNAGGSTAANSNITSQVLPAVPVNTVAPAVTGTPQVGQTLTTTNGTWDNTPTSYTYLWKHGDGSAASATATNSTYVCAAGDVGFGMKCEVTASNAGGSAMEPSNTTSNVLPNAPVNTLAPSCSPTSGTTGDSFVFSSGTWTGSPTSWSWEYRTAGSGSWTEFSTSQNPSALGSVFGAGSWDIRLTASNAGGDSAPAAITGTSITVASASNPSALLMMGIG